MRNIFISALLFIFALAIGVPAASAAPADADRDQLKRYEGRGTDRVQDRKQRILERKKLKQRRLQEPSTNDTQGDVSEDSEPKQTPPVMGSPVEDAPAGPLQAIKEKVEKKLIKEQFCAAKPRQQAKDFIESTPSIKKVYPIEKGIGAPKWMATIPERWSPGQIASLQRRLNEKGYRDYRGRRLAVDGEYGVCTMSAHMTYFYEKTRR